MKIRKSNSSDTLTTTVSESSSSSSLQPVPTMDRSRERYYRKLGVISAQHSPSQNIGIDTQVHPLCGLRDQEIKASRYECIRFSRDDVLKGKGVKSQLRRVSRLDCIAASTCGTMSTTQMGSTEHDSDPFGESPNDVSCVSSLSNHASSSNKPQVTFNSKVLVVPIASSKSYSERLRSRMYNSQSDIARNADRNIFEFTYDGWFWRDCLEEDRMAICSQTGEKIHPAHYAAGYSLPANGIR